MKIIIFTKNIAISEEELIEHCKKLDTMRELANTIGCSYKSVARAIKKYFPEKRPGTLKTILELYGLYKCSKCKSILDREAFYNAPTASGVRNWCKECSKNSNEDYYYKNREDIISKNKMWAQNNSHKTTGYKAAYKVSLNNRRVPWANEDKIKEIYKNCPEGHHVDHIIPLKGKLVSGLHVENNLQYLPAEENLRKSNKYEP